MCPVGAMRTPGQVPSASSARRAVRLVNSEDSDVAFWKPAENPRTRPPRSWAGRAQALAAAMLVAGEVLLVIAQDGTRHWALAISDAAGFTAAGLLVGRYVHTRRAYLGELSDRARRLEREREQTRALAAAEERARIAREMHDSVAHHLTVIVALSDGALRAVTWAPGEACDAIRDVSGTARQALAETRQLLGVLRADSA